MQFDVIVEEEVAVSETGAAIEVLGVEVSDLEPFYGKNVEEIVSMLSKDGVEVTVQQSTKGSMKATIIKVKGHKSIAQIQVHPGGGIHGGAYLKISTTDRGIVKFVNKATYKSKAIENATIIYK